MRRIGSLLLGAALAVSMLPPSHAAAAQPELVCPSAILVEKETGEVLYEKEAREKLEPASVTKIMTLLLVLEAVDDGQLDLTEPVTVSANAAGMGGSQVYLKEGEQMTVHEMLKCVAVVSGNDCAVALAEHLCGSEGAFVDRMNERAGQLGMEDTTFLNCTGLPAQGHLTSARDISLMARELIREHPSIREYTTIWMDSIRGGAFGLTNTNRLIRFYPGATGLKTGSTGGALYCMAATAEREGMELIAVIMKAPTTAQRFADAKTLLDYGFANFALTNVYPEEPIPPVEVVLGKAPQVQPLPERECRLLLPRGQQDVRTEVTLPDRVEAPVEEGQALGQMEIYLEGQLRDTVPLVAAEPVERKSFGGVLSDLLGRLFLCV